MDEGVLETIAYKIIFRTLSIGISQERMVAVDNVLKQWLHKAMYSTAAIWRARIMRVLLVQNEALVTGYTTSRTSVQQYTVSPVHAFAKLASVCLTGC